MNKFLILLRAVNVSGQNKIKMVELKEALEVAGFVEVKTYIQSGNVFVSSNEKQANKVEEKVKLVISDSFNLDVYCLAVAKEDLQVRITNNPFAKKPDVDTKQLYVVFTSRELNDSDLIVLDMEKMKPDEVVFDRSHIYIKYSVSAGRSKLTNKYIENKLKVFSTMRNWNTVNKLLEMY
ncbi:MAG: DUF1697 domain-containing protein [Flavobacteriales bacterium]|nr:DUF1697 domain-containing protein [Flavobacteriales bacterium]